MKKPQSTTRRVIGYVMLTLLTVFVLWIGGGVWNMIRHGYTTTPGAVMEIHNVDARVVKRYPSAVAIEWSAELVNKTAKELTTALRFKMYDVDHNLLYSDRGVATVAGQSRSVYRDDTPAVIDHATFARLEKYEVAFQ